jgi:hypothetical protein
VRRAGALDEIVADIGRDPTDHARTADAVADRIGEVARGLA